MADDKYDFKIIRINAYASIEEKETQLKALGELKWVLWAIMPIDKEFEYYFSKKKP